MVVDGNLAYLGLLVSVPGLIISGIIWIILWQQIIFKKYFKDKSKKLKIILNWIILPLFFLIIPFLLVLLVFNTGEFNVLKLISWHPIIGFWIPTIVLIVRGLIKLKNKRKEPKEKRISKLNLVNGLSTLAFIIIGFFIRLVPSWMKMRNGTKMFLLQDFGKLIFEYNFNNIENIIGIGNYYAYWGVSYLFILIEILIIYFLASFIYFKLKK